MFRRLNFLLPNVQLAQKVASELNQLGVNHNNIHTYSGIDLPTGALNPATHSQVNDEAQQAEDILWNGNLMMFFLFLVICLAAIIFQQYLLAILSIGVMLISFATGTFFAIHIPHTHLNNFKHAINHNELLMMVDVPEEKMGYIDNKIHRHHPALVEGGSSWMLRGVDI